MSEQITPHKEKAIALCHTVLNAYKNKDKIFSNPDIEKSMNPEKILIDAVQGSNETKAKWLFFAVADMQQKNSRVHFSDFKNFYKRLPNVLNNEQLNCPDCPFTFYPPQKFLRNAKMLLEKYDGNPLKITEGKSAEDALKELKKFEGIGIKHSKMYLHFLAKHGLADIDVSRMGPAIDTHFIKISYGCDVFDFEDGTRVDKTRGQLDNLYSEIVKEEKMDSSTLDSSVWIIGHKSCSKNNETACKIFCPLEEMCSKNLPRVDKMDTRLYWKKPDRKNTNQYILPLKL